MICQPKVLVCLAVEKACVVSMTPKAETRTQRNSALNSVGMEALSIQRGHKQEEKVNYSLKDHLGVKPPRAPGWLSR